MNPLNRIRAHVLTVSLWLAYTAMAVIGLMMLTIAYDVVVRYVLAAPTDWAYPLNSTAVLAATSLTLPHLYARGRHISMDLLHRAMPPAGRRTADLVTSAVTTLLGAVLAVTGYRSLSVALEAGLTGSGTFSIPLWVANAVLLLTGSLLAGVALLFPPGGAEPPGATAEPPTGDTAADRAAPATPEGASDR